MLSVGEVSDSSGVVLLQEILLSVLLIGCVVFLDETKCPVCQGTVTAEG